MIKSREMVMEELRDYSSPKARLTRLLKSGTLVQIRRGLFVDDLSLPPQTLAPLLYGPSYISFQSALAESGLIPERVTTISSASYNKNKDKTFHTPLGAYQYLYLPVAVYPYGILQVEEQGIHYLIASPEKALCDAVYKVAGAASIDAIELLLLEDWRMEREDLLRLDIGFIRWIAPRYRRKSLIALAAWFAREAP
jgi:predicted transcriptional regulator of viral defense system